MASHLSYTKAAQQLCVTQPAVSHSVQKLEAELGCQLFDRTAKKIQLTKEGTVLYDYVKRAFEELQAGVHRIKELTDYHAGELRIGATETAIRFLLAPQISRFKEQHPNARIGFTGSNTRDTCAKLLEQKIEIAFLFSPIPQELNFNLIKIGEVQDVLAASREFPIDHSRIFSMEEIVQYPMIYVGEENSVRAYIDRWFLECKFRTMKSICTGKEVHPRGERSPLSRERGPVVENTDFPHAVTEETHTWHGGIPAPSV